MCETTPWSVSTSNGSEILTGPCLHGPHSCLDITHRRHDDDSRYSSISLMRWRTEPLHVRQPEVQDDETNIFVSQDFEGSRTIRNGADLTGILQRPYRIPVPQLVVDR